MLRVISQDRERPESVYRATSEPTRFESGFYFEEWNFIDRFRWMGLEGRIAFDRRDQVRFLEIWVLSAYYDLSQTLTTRVGDDDRTFALPRGWCRLSIPIPAGTDRLDLAANKLYPAAYYPNDPRELAVQVRSPILHLHPERHTHIERQYSNAIANIREMLDGETALDSTPQMLGIDLHGVCNVKPPCVYCDWDSSKDLEGDNVDTPFTRETLEEYGAYFDNAVELVNCSIGEPFMMKNLDELLDVFGETGKVLEVATNGQILTDRNIERLVGRDIDLFISLDAATSETYSKLRNDSFERIIDNLRRLIAAKGGVGQLPRVHLIFMPMRVNIHELEAFVELCAELQVDRMVLRPLNYAEALDLDWDRGGYRFNYEDELLPFDQLIRSSARAVELGSHRGVVVADQLDFGGAMQETFAEEYASERSDTAEEIDERKEETGATAELESSESHRDSTEAKANSAPLPIVDDPPSIGAEKVPLCTEPWKSLYILRRGILPCCYGGHPIAQMNEYDEVWNSQLLQGIRRELAAGRFHRYCLDSPSCPIVRKSSHAQSLPPQQALFLLVRKAWHRLDRMLFRVPGRIVRPVKEWVRS
ncbi:MAG: radical SAM/SPASM domain-containing protein [Thermoanaerobaculia bacterium]